MQCGDGGGCLWDWVHTQQQGTSPGTTMGWGRAGAGVTDLLAAGKPPHFIHDAVVVSVAWECVASPRTGASMVSQAIGKTCCKPPEPPGLPRCSAQMETQQ